jgi:hypothetical protein
MRASSWNQISMGLRVAMHSAPAAWPTVAGSLTPPGVWTDREGLSSLVDPALANLGSSMPRWPYDLVHSIAFLYPTVADAEASVPLLDGT